MASILARVGLLIATVLLPLMQAPGRLSAQDKPHSSLTGQLLIASPSTTDPRFFRAVILMVRHDQNSALGITINRPVQERPLAALLEAFGDKAPAGAGNVRIFAGGPLQPEIGFVVHSAEYRRHDTIDLGAEIAVTSSREILRDIADNRGPMKSLIAFGYAGWGPGQLERELDQRFWFTTSLAAKLVFDPDSEKVWDEAIKHRTREL
jgi:putative transcriptional regulator